MSRKNRVVATLWLLSSFIFAGPVNASEAPPPPGWVAATMRDAFRMTYDVRWGAEATADYYRIRRICPDQSASDCVAPNDVVELDAISTVLTERRSLATPPGPAGTYQYEVQACSRKACSAAVSSGDFYVDLPTPEAVAEVSLTTVDVTTGEYRLNWGDRSELWVDEYRVKRTCPAAASGCTTEFAIPAGTFAADQQLVVGGTYTFEVTACNSDDECSAYVSTGPVTVADPDLEPNPPEDFLGSWISVSPLQYQLSWDAPKDGPAVDFYRLLDGDTGTKLVDTTALNFLITVSKPEDYGDKTYELYAMSDSGQSSDAVELDWTVPTNTINSPPPATPISEFNALVNQHKAESSNVGATAGQFRVDEQGNATYAIDFMTAPSAGGVAPSIGLSYSSAGANGDVGVGWAITGLSSITRCAQTYEQDGAGAVAGIQVDYSDRFCLDGERLLLASGSSYGAHNAQYRLESDPFTKIQSKGAVGNGPNWFKVWRKDGSVSEYGRQASSKIRIEAGSAQVTVLTWAVNQIKDSVGNKMDFEYCSSNDSASNANCPDQLDEDNQVEFHISSILYGSTSQRNRLSFIWSSNRADAAVAYVGGGRLTSSYLLQRVDSFGRGYPDTGEKLLRSYHLGYDPLGDGYGHPVLQEVRECSNLGGTQCFPPLTFEWNKSSNALFSGKADIPIGGSSSSDLNLFPDNYISGQPADLDGDGRQELVYLHNADHPKLGYVKIGGALGSQTVQPRRQAVDNVSNELLDNASGWNVLDYNLDGRDDIVYVHKSGNSRYWRAYAGQQSAPYISSTPVNIGYIGNWSDSSVGVGAVSVQDINGDGRSDLIYVVGGELQMSLNQAGPGQPVSSTFADAEPIDFRNSDAFELYFTGLIGVPDVFPSTVIAPAKPFDLDNDGAADLLVKVTADVNFGPPTAASEVPRFMSSQQQSDYLAQRTFGADEGYYSAWYIAKAIRGDSSAGNSAGLSYELTTQAVAIAADCQEADNHPSRLCDGVLNRVGNIEAVDMNADGLADLVTKSVAFQDHQLGIWTNTGEGFPIDPQYDPFDYLTQIHKAKYSQLVDFDGDGRVDILHTDGSDNEQTKWQVRRNTAAGFGHTSELTFAHARNVDGSTAIPANKDTSIFFDANGDGRLDQFLINRDNDGVVNGQTHFRRGYNEINGDTVGPNNVINRFVGSYGDYTEIDYRPLTDTVVYKRDCVTTGTNCGSNGATWGAGSAVFDLISPMYVVSAAVSSAPAASVTHNGGSSFTVQSTNASSQSMVLYEYRGAKLQGGGRGFLGFREIVSTDGQLGVETTTQYRQDFPFIGRPIETERRLLDGTLIARSTGTWASQTISGSGGANFVYQDTTDDWSYDTSGNLLSRVFSDSDYNDGWGNATNIVVQTFDGTSGNDLVEQKTTVNTYTNSSSKWHLGRLTNATVTTTLDDGTSATRQTSFGYDSVSGLLKTETVEPGHAKSVTKTYVLDGFGNRTSTTVSSEGVSRVISQTYDPSGRYLLSKTNALGQIESEVTEYDHWGNPLESEDMRDVVTTHAVDLMGRPMGSYSPTGAYQVQYYDTQACPFANAPVAFRMVSVAGGGTVGTVCYDILGREILKSSQALGDNNTIATVIVETEYDSQGRTIRVSEPAFSGDPQYWTNSALNELGHADAIQHPNGSYTQIQYLPGNIIRTIDPLGHVRDETRNGLGQTLEVEETNDAVSPAQTATIIFDETIQASQRVKSVTGADGHQVRTTLDIFGNKIEVDDPDKGVWQYSYNGFGELTCHIDANGDGSRYEYDALGRMIERIDSRSIPSLQNCQGTDARNQRWTYGNTHGVPGYGLLIIEQVCNDPNWIAQGLSGCAIPGGNGQAFEGFKVSHNFDSLGRITETYTEITNEDGYKWFAQTTAFDQYGRLFQSFDAAGDLSGVEYEYNSVGTLVKIKDAVQGGIHEEVREMDARGNATLVRYDNNTFSVARIFEPDTGLLESSISSQGDHWLEFDFDDVGNLEKRRIYSGGSNIVEDFEYDDFNRLTKATLNGPTGVRVNNTEYDVAGNITYRDYAGNQTLGSYQYGQVTCGIQAGPHAATSVGGVSYCYDENGNRTSSSGGELISYSAFDKPTLVEKGSSRLEYSYGANRERLIKRSVTPGKDVTTYYIGSVEVVIDKDGDREYRRYVGSSTLLISRNGNQAGVERNVLVKDHLGSLDVIIDDGGFLKEQTSFDAWGLRRDVSDPLVSPLQGVLDALHAVTDRGFGGHESLDEFGFVDMGGRMYDAVIGRFLQADPFIQSPKNAQNLNRYSYVLNNPLSLTDPTGYFFEELKENWRTVAAIVISVFLPYAAPAVFGSGLVGAVATGFVAGSVGSGSLKGGLIGAFSAGIFHGIGTAYSGAEGSGSFFGTKLSGGAFAGKVAAHGVAGGVMSELQGGKFGHGFVSAGLTQAFSGKIDTIGNGSIEAMPARVMAAAVVGGTASAVTGGKFANGAITGAFSRAFNDEDGEHRRGREERGEGTCSAEACVSTAWKEVDPMLIPGSPSMVWNGVERIPELSWVTLSPPIGGRLNAADPISQQFAYETGYFTYTYVRRYQLVQVIDDFRNSSYQTLPMPGVPIRYGATFQDRLAGDTEVITRIRSRVCLGGACFNFPRF